MRTTFFLLAIMILASLALAQTDQPVVNFNLLQVNQYNGAPPPSDSTSLADGRGRVVVDMQNPRSMVAFFGASTAHRAPVTGSRYDVVVTGSMPAGKTVEWETGMMLRSASGEDSFFVRSSKIGCPGTEVKPSVSVAFAMGNGWSDPPIRFGPLCERTVCPLGHGYQLEVFARSGDAPMVRLIEPDTWSGRK